MGALLKFFGVMAVLMGLLAVSLIYLPVDVAPFLASLLGVHYVKVVPTENGNNYYLPIVLILIGIVCVGLGKLARKRKINDRS